MHPAVAVALQRLVSIIETELEPPFVTDRVLLVGSTRSARGSDCALAVATGWAQPELVVALQVAVLTTVTVPSSLLT